MLNIDQIKRLAAFEANPCVSVFLPTHRMGPETEQDPIRLKNLLSHAEKRLMAGGLRRPDAEILLEKAQRLIDDYEFWQHQSDGLAVFIAPSHTVVLRLPATMPEEVHIGVRFHIKHLLPVIANNGRFYLLTIAQDQVRLYEGSRHSLAEVESEHIPESIAKVRGLTAYEEKVGFHPTGPTSTTTGRPSAKHHAGGESPQDVRENELKEWLHQVANGVAKQLGEEAAPLVVAADERNFGHFKTYFDRPHLLGDGITEHPEALDEEGLHSRAWELIEPVFAKQVSEAQEQYASLAGEAHERARHDVSSIIEAARSGRIGTLFVAEDVHLSGVFDAETGVAKTQQNGDGEDLLDRATAEALVTGASVYALPKEHVPGGNGLAAILRF